MALQTQPQRSIAPWLRAVIAGAVMARVASFIALGPANSLYFRLTSGQSSQSFSAFGNVRALFWKLPFAWWLGCGVLFAWAYREWAWLRRDVAHRRGLLSVAAILGSAQALAGQIVFREYRWGVGFVLVNWVVEMLFAAPFVVWAIRELHPRDGVIGDELPPQASGAAGLSRDAAYRQIVIGLLLAMPSMWGLRWLFTSEDAGYLMVLWLVPFLAEMIALLIGVSLVRAGILTLRGVAVSKAVRFAPIAVVIGAMLLMFCYAMGMH